MATAIIMDGSKVWIPLSKVIHSLDWGVVEKRSGFSQRYGLPPNGYNTPLLWKTELQKCSLLVGDPAGFNGKAVQDFWRAVVG